MLEESKEQINSNSELSPAEFLGFKELSRSEGNGSFNSRSERIEAVDEKDNSITLHIKWFGREDKEELSRFEPEISKLTRSYGLPTPKVLAYLKTGESYNNRMWTGKSCVVSEYSKTLDGGELINLSHVHTKLTRIQRRLMLESTTSILSRIHLIEPHKNSTLFLRGLNIDPLQKAYRLVDEARNLEALTQKSRIMILQSLLHVDTSLRLTHKDFYHGNMLVPEYSPDYLAAVVDWEKAEFAPRGEDFFITAAVHIPEAGFDPQTFWVSYRNKAKISEIALMHQLQSFGVIAGIEILKIGIAKNIPDLIRYFEYYIKTYLK